MPVSPAVSSDARTSPAGLAARLPDYPWDALAPYARRAALHPDGIVDLSIGTPVDPTPTVIQAALQAAGNAPGYPPTAGTPQLRSTVAAWFGRRHGVTVDPAAVLPTIGSKELVAWLPTLLGLGPADLVVIPPLAYPTYAVGVAIAGAQLAAPDNLTALGPARPRLMWVNSPGNPTGAVLPPAHLAKLVAWARERGTVVVSDECYLDLTYDGERALSVLHPEVCGGSHDGLLAVHSTSKHSNLAGYRAGFVAGDPALVAQLLAVRKHAGMMVPAPVQAAMTSAYGDDSHIEAQAGRYRVRRSALWPAVEAAGFQIDDSTAGLYLWATRDEDCMASVAWFADRGILCTPGTFYGSAGGRHIRLSLTATDERIASAVRRLRG